jgi:flavin reductase (DIM6/NTAB) family NADH-FMN oxidoreductase RutF
MTRRASPRQLAARHDDDPAVAADTFRHLFRRHAAGVVIVTVDGPAERPLGFTATSLTSVSLAPPLLSIAVASGASAWPALAQRESFVVNFLGTSHQTLADRFATRGIDRFAPPTRWSRLPSGEPRLDDASAWARCRITERIPVGDHHLVLGLVVDGAIPEPSDPLLYHDGGYHALAPTLQTSRAAAS